jgi:hypothetical protein
MKDAIDKNLEFKMFSFVTLLGSWIWLINFYLSLIPLSSNDYISFPIIIFSFIIFYPLFPLGMMLIYSSLYQIEDRDEKIIEIKKKYSDNSKSFFGWWPIVITITPAFLMFCIFKDFPFFVGLIVVILAVFIIKTSFFNNIFSWKDIKKYYKVFVKSFFLYFAFFAALILFLWFSNR